MKHASPQEVADYYKNLIKVCGKGEGFILNIHFPDKATIEDCKKIVDSIREYGIY